MILFLEVVVRKPLRGRVTAYCKSVMILKSIFYSPLQISLWGKLHTTSNEEIDKLKFCRPTKKI